MWSRVGPRRLQDIELDAGYDTLRRTSEGALARVSQTAVCDTCCEGIAIAGRQPPTETQLDGQLASQRLVPGRLAWRRSWDGFDSIKLSATGPAIDASGNFLRPRVDV